MRIVVIVRTFLGVTKKNFFKKSLEGHFFLQFQKNRLELLVLANNSTIKL
jgi:hypothetical protein